MKKLATIGIAIVAIAAALVSAQVALAKPVGMSPAEYRALLLRSEGLNHRFGVTDVRSLTLERSPSERFSASNPIRQNVESPAPAGMTRDEYRALLLRSEGLNKKYGVTNLGQITLERANLDRFGIDNPLRERPVATTTSSDSSTIAWDNIGMGMGAALGLLALVATAVIGVRHHQQGHLRTS
jgi:hypothetical protein